MPRLVWLQLCTPRLPPRQMLMPGTDTVLDTVQDTAMVPVPTSTLDTGIITHGQKLIVEKLREKTISWLWLTLRIEFIDIHLYNDKHWGCEDLLKSS